MMNYETKTILGGWNVAGMDGVALLEIECGIEDVAIIQDITGEIEEHTIQYNADGDAYLDIYGGLYFKDLA